MIEIVGDGDDIDFGEFIEAHFFRKKLPDQSVHVLVGATLPRAIWMGKEEVCTDASGDALVLCKLFSIVGCQRVHPVS